jgi:outer membrane protein assembly factor BamB
MKGNIMNKLKGVMFLMILILLCSVCYSEQGVSLFRNNSARTGESQYNGLDSPNLAWSYYTGAYITSTPAVDSNGNLYFGDHNGVFYSLSAPGTVNWSYKTGDIIASSAAIDSSGSIYFGGLDGKIYALDSGGSLKWSYLTGDSIYSSPNLSGNNVYIGSDDHKLYALDLSGQLLWTFDTGSWISSSPSVDSTGNIYFGSYDGKLYSLSSNGTLNWSYDTGTYIYSSPCVVETGKVVFGGYNGVLYSIKNNLLQWSYQTGSVIYSSPAVSSTTGNIYFGSNDCCVYSLKSDGKLLWSYKISVNPLKNNNFSTSPVLDKAGNVYIGSYNRTLYSLNSLGVPRWTYSAGLAVIASPVLAGDNLLYLSSTDRKIHAITGSSLTSYLFSPDNREEAYLDPVITSVPDGFYKRMLEKGRQSVNPNDINDPNLGAYLDERNSVMRNPDDCNTDPSLDKFAFSDGIQQPTALDEAMKLLHLDYENFMNDIYFVPKPVSYLLNITADVMNEPLKTLDYAHEQVDIVQDASVTDYDLVKDGAGLLDLEVGEINFTHALTKDPLVDAIAEIYQDFGNPMSTAERNTLKTQVQSMPLILQKATAFLIYACKEAATKRDESIATLTSADRTYLNTNVINPEAYYTNVVLDVLNTCKKIDRVKLSEAAMVITSAINNIGSVLNEKAQNCQTEGLGEAEQANGDVEGDVLFFYPTPLGSIIIGGPGKTIYKASLDSLDKTREPLLIIDIGGNDEYYNRAGATYDISRSISIVLDLSGNDLYSCQQDFAQGSAKLGVGYLIDFSGNDKYMAGRFAQGSAYIGVGILHDMVGNDTYEGTFDVQSAAMIGIGILNEGSGDDEYSGDTGCQSYGFCQGAAILREASGDDYYYAGGGSSSPYDNDPGTERYTSQAQGAAFGIRFYATNEPHASGGAAVLSDYRGNDIYIGDFYSQGSAYWLDTAMLIDSAGNDLYFSRQYSQGAGIHLAVGLLLDESGDDSYITRAVSQGCGHDTASGLLVDNGGNDIYVTQDLSQGGGNALALSLLSDASGNDQYFAEPTHSSQGYGDFRENTASIGIIIDVGGFDYYTEPLYDDNRHWTKSSYGIGIDKESGDAGVH